ncbi:alpha-xylosidase [Natronosporangium hydrolyticum]|uniref:Alpha-xylosidase n=1 Tax=Natronosporangium hydrolyticum TaxID=2811111 RepID=A0A895YK75_9ACTN|nr:TIM-barrel domain-containing protein [Natronosporangium hydrolyticum]QSB16405.1 alpha-xylosidase [Natronosporangium hydrolyticum]
MPYRPPLVSFETFVADPPDLPVRGPGEQGLSALTRAELIGTDPQGTVTIKGSTSSGEMLVAQVAIAGEGVIRVKLSQDPDARSRSAAATQLVSPGHFYAGRVEVDGGTIRVHAGSVCAELTLDPWHLRFVDLTGRELLAQHPGEHDISGRLRTLPFGRSTVDGEAVAYHESFAAPAEEKFVGFGEKFTPLDKRGQRPLMWNFDAFGAESDRSHKAVPFYLSNRGYGIVVDSGTPIEFDVCQSTHSCVQIVVPDDLLDYYVIAGPTPVEVLRRFHRLTGAPQPPPKWSFGTWISSGFFADTQEQVLARAAKIRELNIPCDVLHLDCYWQTVGHWSDMQWDSEHFPDPAQLLRTLADQGFRVCLWMNPYLSRQSPLFQAAADAGYLLKRPDGSTYVADVWHGTHPASGIVDFTNPAAARWFAELLRPLLEQGVAVFKTDFAEGVPADSVAHNGMTGVALHNVYTLLFNDVVSDITAEVAGHRMVWARSSYLGGQRHAAQWSGDVKSSYPAMASTLRGGLCHGLSGVPYWSHDVGGFNGPPSPDLYVRWAQFGALSPLVRFHGTSTRLPWEFPETAQQGAVDALRLRYRLMPYLYSTAIEAALGSAPMLRALLIDSPDDPAAWREELTYRLGPDLLVAPIFDPSGEQTVYLPAGESWVDWWTGEVHAGGGYLRVTVPLGQIPLFARYGALIPTAELGDTVGEAPFPALTLLSFGGESGRMLLHDVDGDTVISTARDGDTFTVTTTGPARVAAVEFPTTAGTTPPVYVNLPKL